MEKVRVFTAFSGYDSQCLALKKLGVDYDLVGWSEIDKHAINAHNILFPQFKERNYGDISKIDWSQVPDFDLFTYSSPCQDFSLAGKQKGGEEVNIGDKIKSARLSKGMTQQELGDMLGVQKSAIAKYESGRVVNIKRSTLKKISDILGIRPSELVFDLNSNPVGTAELHFEMVTDEDFVDLYAEYKFLDKKKRKIVKDLVHSLVEA